MFCIPSYDVTAKFSVDQAVYSECNYLNVRLSKMILA